MRETVGVFGGLQHEVQVADDGLRLTRRQTALQRTDLFNVLSVLLRLTGDVRVMLEARLLQLLRMLLRRDPVAIKGLLVLGLTLLGPSRMLRGGEHTPQGRGALDREVALARGRRRRSDRERVEHRVQRRLLQRLEVEVIVDAERRREHALQDLYLMLNLCRVLSGLLHPVLRVHAVPEFLVLHGRAVACGSCGALGLGCGARLTYSLPFGFPLHPHKCGDDSASTGHWLCSSYRLRSTPERLFPDCCVWLCRHSGASASSRNSTTWFVPTFTRAARTSARLTRKNSRRRLTRLTRC